MAGQSRLINTLQDHWKKKLEGREEWMEQILQTGGIPFTSENSPTELVAACSLLAARKPLHEVILSIERYSTESVTPGFDQVFFQELQSTLKELELAGLRSHTRKLLKVGQAIANLHRAKDWQAHWSHVRNQNMASAIKDEPFYPQQG
jgi:hypothetical protein